MLTSSTLGHILVVMMAMGTTHVDARVRHPAPKGRWLTGGPTGTEDTIQRQGLKDGYYSADGSDNARIWSTEQARKCVKGKVVVFGGDSYSMQCYMGLSEVLTGEVITNEVASGSRRSVALREAQTAMASLAPDDIHVAWTCSKIDECYGDRGYLDLCIKCLQTHHADVVVLSTGIHMMSRFRKVYQADADTISSRRFQQDKMSTMLNETLNAFENVPNLIWGTPPSYRKAKIPEKYRETMPLSDMEHYYYETLRLANMKRVRVVDFHTMTEACAWDNCTSDGGHRARFVNRAKAQAVLELMCPDMK
eukprot:m.215447 g.215447  ORF g.215447 m.215447 type:complete len:307 (-) comp27885_c0_seq1:20-940(-)